MAHPPADPASAAAVMASAAGSAALASLIATVGPAYVEIGMAAAGGFFGASLAITGTFFRTDNWSISRGLLLILHLILPIIAAIATAGTAAFLLARVSGLGTDQVTVSSLVFITAGLIGRFTMNPRGAGALFNWVLDAIDRLRGVRNG